MAQTVNNLPADSGGRIPGFDPWVWKIPGEGNGYPLQYSWSFPVGLDSKESACDVRDLGLICVSGRCPGEANGYPLQYSCLENSMNRGVHGITKSQTRLKQLSIKTDCPEPVKDLGIGFGLFIEMLLALIPTVLAC